MFGEFWGNFGACEKNRANPAQPDFVNLKECCLSDFEKN